MSILFEKVSYLKGLADGMDLDSSTKEGKLLLSIIDALGEFAEVIEEIDEDLSELDDAILDIDEDLTSLEEDFYDEDYIEELDCPECGEVIYLDDDMLLQDTVICPSCGKELDIEDDNCDSDCSCTCGCEE